MTLISAATRMMCEGGGMMIKVKDLLGQSVCMDVYDNVCEELAIAFDGPQKLTEEGKNHFAEVLEYEVKIHYNGSDTVAIVDVDGEDWEDRLEKAKELFYGAAGYCSVEDYDKWFV